MVGFVGGGREPQSNHLQGCRAFVLATGVFGCFLETSGFVIETREMEPLLLVEDKSELRAMMRKALERAGYAVDEAPDGAAAIQKVRERRYLLVITDFEMPGASGTEHLREPKQADATIPVLLLTAYGS